MHWQYRTISRGKHSILHNLYTLLGAQTPNYISFYGLRAHGRLSDGGPLVTSQVRCCIQVSYRFLFNLSDFAPTLQVPLCAYYLRIPVVC